MHCSPDGLLKGHITQKRPLLPEGRLITARRGAGGLHSVHVLATHPVCLPAWPPGWLSAGSPAIPHRSLAGNLETSLSSLYTPSRANPLTFLLFLFCTHFFFHKEYCFLACCFFFPFCSNCHYLLSAFQLGVMTCESIYVMFRPTSLTHCQPGAIYHSYKHIKQKEKMH